MADTVHGVHEIYVLSCIEQYSIIIDILYGTYEIRNVASRWSTLKFGLYL